MTRHFELPLVGWWTALAPPASCSEEQIRVGRAVRLLGVSGVVGLVPPLIVQWRHGWMAEFWTLIGTGLALTAALWLNQRGRAQWAARTLTWAGLGCASGMVYFSGYGYQDLSLLMFPGILVVGALLTSWRFYAGFAITVVLLVAAGVVLQIYRLNPYAQKALGSYSDLLMITIILTLTALSAGLLSAALRRSLSDYQALFQQAGEGVVVLDEDRCIRMANASAGEILGVPEKALRNRSLQDFVPIEEWPAFERQSASRRAGGKIALELSAQRPDGTCRKLLVTCTARTAERGRRSGSIAVFRDVTEERALREQFLQAQKLETIGRLAGGVAHDFNNLLTVINGFSELLSMSLDPDSPLRPHLELILKAGEQAATLSHQLLVFSRKQASEPRPVNLNHVIEDVRKMLSRVLGAEIEVETSLNPDLGLVMADPTQMHQVLINLVLNARDAMPGGGRLTLATANLEVGPGMAAEHPGVPTGSYMHMIVADTGTGIPDHILGRIFEPFTTTKEADKGTGFGLATVYGIVRQSGGWINVQSQAGRGTAFHLYLPLATEPMTVQHTIETPVAELSGSETILLVEDQTSVLQFVQSALESYGYRVLPASDGPSAITVANEFNEPIHLLLTDLAMPGMDGRVLAGKLKTTRPNMRILYMTGCAANISGSPAPADAGADCLLKPLQPGMLAAKVREVLTTYEARRGTTNHKL